VVQASVTYDILKHLPSAPWILEYQRGQRLYLTIGP
jgi:hypothetical protein